MDPVVLVFHAFGGSPALLDRIAGKPVTMLRYIFAQIFSTKTVTGNTLALSNG
jgi:hypothetical protein